MTERRLTSATLCVMLLIATAVPGIAHPPTAAANTALVINPGVVYQPAWEGWGTSLAWFGNIVGGWSTPTKTAIADLVFGSSGLNMNIVRYNIGASPDPNTDTSMLRGRAIPSFLTVPGVYDWSKDANQRWILQAAKARGANVFEAFSNSPPWFMTKSGDASGANDCGNNLKDDQYDAFADYLTEVVKHFKNNEGISFRTLAPVNEPNAGYWCAWNGQEGAGFSVDKQDLIITKVGQSLATKGLGRTTIAAPETYSPSEAVSNFTSYGSAARGYISQLNTHVYGSTAYDQATLRDLAATNGKRWWMSEYGVGPGPHDHNGIASALFIAKTVARDINVLRPSAWGYWQAVESEEEALNRNDNGGLIHATFAAGSENYTITKSFYGFGNFSKFIRPGYQIIASGDENTVAAYNYATNTLVLVTVNDSTSNIAIDYDLTKFTSVTGTAHPYRTSATENVAQQSDMAITNKRFTATANANSITTYVVSGVTYDGGGSALMLDDRVTGSGYQQWDYIGNAWESCTNCGTNLYAGSNSWNATTDQYVVVRFTGTQIRLYGVKDPGHGIGGASVDGGPESDVDFYAATRAGNQLLWVSSVLPPGSHTLKVRVTGRKNDRSNNVGIALDRVDVAGTGTAGLVNPGFETGNLNGWSVVSGSAFSVADVTDLPTASGGNGQTFNQQGSYHLWGFKDGGDGQLGVLKSGNFTLTGAGTVDFLISGGNDINKTYVALARVSDNAELLKATGANSEAYGRVTFNASAYLGTDVYLKVVDTSTGSWGHINIDDVRLNGAASGQNLVTNPGFEQGSPTQTPSGWTTSAGGGGAYADADYTEGTSGTGGPRTGSFKATHWRGTTYDVGTYQTITGLANGTYTLKAWVMSGGGQGSVYMEAKDFGGSARTTAIPTTATWSQISITGINVTNATTGSNGTATIGFWSYANANNWMHFDDVEFYRE